MNKSTRPTSRRRFLQLVAATGVTATGIVAGCAPKESKTGSGTTSAGLSGTVNVSYADQAGFKPKYVQQAAAAVHKAHSRIDVKIDLQKVGDDDYYTKLLLRLDSGDAPDVFHIGGDLVGELVGAGYIEPLDDYLAQWQDWSKYPTSVRGGVTYQDQVWAIPYGLDMRWMFYRKDTFAKAGLPADWQPQNVQAILDAANAVKDAHLSKVIPYALYAGAAGSSGTSDHAFLPLLWAYGGQIQDKDGKWVGDSPATRKVMAYYAKAFQPGLSPKEILTDTAPWTAMREKLGNGQLALLYEGGWVYGGWQEADKAATEKNVGYVLHPTDNGDPAFTVGGPGTCWYIAAKSKNKQAAWEFIKAVNSAEIVGKLNAEDPHPVARTDAADIPEFKSSPYLVASTEALSKARFVGPQPDYQKVILAIQKATGRVASGEVSPEEGAKRYSDDLEQAIGSDKVVSQ